MNNEIRVLILEDAPVDAELAERELRRAGIVFTSKRVDTKDAFVRALEEFSPDIVLADYSLPAFDGLSAVQIVREKHPQVPVIMVTGTLGDEAAVELLKAGARDYVLKDGLKRLGPAVRRALSDEEGIRARKQAERAVKDSERRFRSLIEHASDFVAVVDAQGKIGYISPSVRRLGGYEVDEVVGTHYLDYAHPEDRPAATAGLAELLRDPGKLHVSDFRFRAKDGAWVTLESIARNALDDPAINGIVINSRDITERKHAEDKIAKLNRLYATLSGINMAIVRAASPAELFDDVCEVAVEHGRFCMAWIGTLDRADQMVAPVAQRGLSPEDMVMIRDSIGRIADGRGRSATAIREGRMIYTNDYDAERTFTPWQAEAVKRGIHGSATLPINQGGEVVGVLKLYVSERDFFDSDQLALLEEMRTDISFALDRFDTEAKKTQAEAALRESEERFRSINAAAQDAVMMIDDDGRLAYWNPAAERILGYRADEALGQEMHRLIAPARYLSAYEKGFAAFRASGEGPVVGKMLEMEAVRKDGREISVELSVSALKLKGRWHAVGMLRDITERRLAEATRAELAALVASSRDAIYGTDVDGIVTVWNAGAEQVFGYTESEVVGRPVTILVPEELAHEPVQLRQQALRGEAVSDFETVRLRKDGRRIDVAFTISPLRDASGNAAGVSVVARDISERKRAEEELKRLNWALRALGQSNSALVHAETEKDLFQACCEAIAGTGDYPLAWIGLARDDPAHSIEIVAVAGEATRYTEGLAVSWADAPIGRGPSGTSIRTGVTQVTNNLAESTAYLPWIARARASGLASSISLPINPNGAVMGALMVYGRAPDLFGEHEIKLFEELAADIGYGIGARRTRTERDGLQQEQLRGVERLKAALIGTIGAVALTVEKRDPYTAGHQQRVAELCMAIGRKMDFAEDRLEGLRLGATIHDIGKIYVPAEILNRPGKLSAPEFEMIKSHPQVGYDIVKEVKFPWPVTDMILQHHERLDGSGYPNGLKGDAIIFEARILAVADVIEAMSSHRPYRPGLGIDAALEEIVRNRGRYYDPAVADACADLFRKKEFSWT
jgi:PAS domain S-box-containing protein